MPGERMDIGFQSIIFYASTQTNGLQNKVMCLQLNAANHLYRF